MIKATLSRDLMTIIKRYSNGSAGNFYEKHKDALDFSLMTFYRIMRGEATRVEHIERITSTCENLGYIKKMHVHTDIAYLEALVELVDKLTTLAEDHISTDKAILIYAQLMSYNKRYSETIHKVLEEITNA